MIACDCACAAAARKSVALPVSALIISVMGAIFTVVGNIRRDVRTLVGAVCYVLAGEYFPTKQQFLPNTDCMRSCVDHYT